MGDGTPWVLLALMAAGWAASVYLSARRAARNAIQAVRAERQLRALQDQVDTLGGQLRAEQAIVERLPDPLIVLGRDRAVQRANAAADTAFGPGLSAVLRHPGFRAALDRAGSQQENAHADLSFPVPIAREVHATVLAMPGDSAVAVLSDRTRDRAFERMRADFVANASHELRTPLTSLIGFIDTLRGPAADDKAAQIRFLGIMAEQAQRMARLIDDLLSLSRIELTEHLPPSGRVDLAELVRRVAASLAPQFESRRIVLSMELPPDLPALPGDEDQLQQVLQNLLDNAAKYGSSDGRVSISASATPAGMTITVRDDGQGIARSHIPRLTERFYRADAHRSRAVGGTGLGLAIVKHIVNRHRGQLVIDSAEGVGTTVSVVLPI